MCFVSLGDRYCSMASESKAILERWHPFGVRGKMKVRRDFFRDAAVRLFISLPTAYLKYYAIISTKRGILMNK